MKGLCLFLLLLVACTAFIRSSEGRLLDEQGRQITFRGPNVVVKIPPYVPSTDKVDPEMSFGEEDIKQLRSWGFNAIRLGVMWPGVEPSEGKYSSEYLAKMKAIVDLAGSYGIYSLVEFHQDLFSEKFCGDGVPAWALKNIQTATFPMPINSQPYKYNSSGLPDYKQCLKHPWGNYYFSFDVSNAFQALYNNRYGLLDKFEKYWVKVAETFAGNPHVIAYQLINEPFAGAVLRNPLLIDPYVAETLNLQHFYDRLSAAIRRVDDKHPICFEPVTWNNAIKTGFSHPPGGTKYRNQSVLCYHYYSPPDFSLNAIEHLIGDAKRMGVSSLLSQFWYKGTNGSSTIAAANEHQQSWFFWGYKTFGKTWGSQWQGEDEDDEQIGLFYKNGSYITEYVKLLSQTYAPRVSGQIISSNYDHATKDYLLSYYTSNGSTVLYLNKEMNYPRGFVINATPKNSVKITEGEEGLFQVYSLSPVGTKVMITVYKL